MTDPRTFSAESIAAYAAEARAAYEKHKSLTSAGFQRDLLIATAKLAVEAARNFTNRRVDQLALRLDALERKLNEREDNERSAQLTRHAEHLARLQTRLAALEAKADK